METIYIDTLLGMTDLRILRLYLQCIYPSNHSYTAEQMDRIGAHYVRLNGTAIDKDYAQRQIAMATILNMDETDFFEQLYDDRLPPFIRANRFDPDYLHCEPEQISSDLYMKRESLRYYSREMFIARTLNDVSYANYKTRKEAVHQIQEMEMDEFLTGLNEGTLPEFIPATYGDPDYCMLYRTPTFSNRNEFAYSIRGRLCTMTIDEFKTFISIDE